MVVEKTEFECGESDQHRLRRRWNLSRALRMDRILIEVDLGGGVGHEWNSRWR